MQTSTGLAAVARRAELTCARPPLRPRACLATLFNDEPLASAAWREMATAEDDLNRLALVLKAELHQLLFSEDVQKYALITHDEASRAAIHLHSFSAGAFMPGHRLPGFTIAGEAAVSVRNPSLLNHASSVNAVPRACPRRCLIPLLSRGLRPFDSDCYDVRADRPCRLWVMIHKNVYCCHLYQQGFYVIHWRTLSGVRVAAAGRFLSPKETLVRRWWFHLNRGRTPRSRAAPVAHQRLASIAVPAAHPFVAKVVRLWSLSPNTSTPSQPSRARLRS